MCENSLVALNYARTLRGQGNPNSLSAFEDAQKAAEKCGNWESLYHGYAGVGKMHLNRDEPQAAFPWYREALRIAERGDLSYWHAPALHDVFLSLAWAGEETQSRDYLRRAWESYSYKHPRAFAIIHDLEYLKLMRGGEVGVHGALRTPLAYGLKSADLVLPFSNLLYAAGRNGNHSRFYGWLTEFKKVIAVESGEGVALALLGAARGAHALGDTAQAVALLEHSRRVSLLRGETTVQTEADNFLSRLSIVH